MDLTSLFVIAIAMIALITGINQVVKTTFKIPKRFMPIASIVVGVVLGLALYPLTDYTLYTMALAGLVGGLAASGFFDVSKAIKAGDTK